MIELITSISINLDTQTLTAYGNDRVIHVAPISSGRWSSPTPEGEFFIGSKYERTDLTGSDYVINLPWVMCLAGNGLTTENYCLHPNPYPSTQPLGTPLSRGCIRLAQADAEWLFSKTPHGTPVFIF